MTKITDEKSHAHETEIWGKTQGGKNRVVRVRKKNFCCCYEGKILESVCKQLMEMNKGRDGWEIQERTKAAGDSLQWDLHPILVKERHFRILEGKTELCFCYLYDPFTGSGGILCGNGGGRYSTPATWKPLKIML